MKHDSPPDETLRSESRRFAPIPEEMLLDSSLSAGAVRLWGILDRTAARSSIFPGRQRLAEQTRCSTATVDRQIAELTDRGWITVRRRGLGRTNLYTLSDHPQERRSRVITGEDSESSPVRTTESSPVTNYREEGYREEVEREKTPVSVPPSLVTFDEFWSVYPRKVGKPKAEAAWERALRRSTPEAILAGLREHLPGWKVSDPKFVPHPTTWINRDGWADDPPPGAAAPPPRKRIETDRGKRSGRVAL